MSHKITMKDLLMYLRDELVSSMQMNDQARLESLMHTFDVVYDAAVFVQDGSVIGLAEDLLNILNDHHTGALWKIQIPSDEDITKITQEL